MVGALMTLMLFRASGQWAASAPSLIYAWGAIIVGLLPTAFAGGSIFGKHHLIGRNR